MDHSRSTFPPTKHLRASVNAHDNLLVLTDTYLQDRGDKEDHTQTTHTDMPLPYNYSCGPVGNGSMVLSNPWDKGIEHFLGFKEGITIIQPKISPGNSSSGVSSLDGSGYVVEPGPSSSDSGLSLADTNALQDVDEAIEADLKSLRHEQNSIAKVGNNLHLQANDSFGNNLPQIASYQTLQNTKSEVLPPVYKVLNIDPRQPPNPISIAPLSEDNTKQNVGSYKQEHDFTSSLAPCSSTANPQPYYLESQPNSSNNLNLCGSNAAGTSKAMENFYFPGVPAPFAYVTAAVTPPPNMSTSSVITANRPESYSSAYSSSTGKRERSPTPENEYEPSLKKRPSSMSYLPNNEYVETTDNARLATNASDAQPPPFHVIVAKAILSSPNGKMILSDIYAYALEKYPQFETAKCAWRNSIRHSLSVNNCFIKKERAPNGRGYYWAIHPAVIEDFKKGDCNKRMVKRRVHTKERVSQVSNLLPTCPPSHDSNPNRNHTSLPDERPNMLAPLPFPFGGAWPTKAFSSSYFAPSLLHIPSAVPPGDYKDLFPSRSYSYFGDPISYSRDKPSHQEQSDSAYYWSHY